MVYHFSMAQAVEERMYQVVIPNYDPENPKPWEPWPEESVWRYSQFHEFLMMGPRRNLRQLYKKLYGEDRANATHLLEVSKEWEWQERAEAYDMYLTVVDREAEEKARVEARSTRRRIIGAIGEIFESKIPDLKDEDLSWRSAAEMLRTLGDQSRLEYNDVPAQKIESNIRVEETLSTFVQKVAVVFKSINAIDDPLLRQQAFGRGLLELVAEKKELVSGT